jgi:hypothetical protein
MSMERIEKCGEKAAFRIGGNITGELEVKGGR